MDKKELSNLKDFWDSMAERFKDFEIPTPYNDIFMKNLYFKGMFEKGGTALDIGCGGGKYSFAMAPYFEKVIGTDISEQMINYAEERKKDEKNTNTFFRCISWQESDIDELEWENKFDLVFAHMTPAVNSIETMEKMRKASKKWCVITKSVYRKSEIADTVNRICGNKSNSYGDKEMLELFDMLWKEGIMPEVFYEKERWENVLPLNKAAESYIKRMSVKRELTQREIEKIKAYFTDISENGTVTETTDAVLCTVYWKENKEEI